MHDTYPKRRFYCVKDFVAACAAIRIHPRCYWSFPCTSIIYARRIRFICKSDNNVKQARTDEKKIKLLKSFSFVKFSSLGNATFFAFRKLFKLYSMSQVEPNAQSHDGCARHKELLDCGFGQRIACNWITNIIFVQHSLVHIPHASCRVIYATRTQVAIK